MPAIEDILLDVESDTARTDFGSVFGNSRPVELEIGCGAGGFLLRQARAHPERNYFGIEWANKYCRYAADRMIRWGVTNVRLARTDARHFVIHRLSPGCLAGLHVYHPDPWPKKRHHKRRLFTPEFVNAAVRALQAGALWAIQTDHAEYFDVIRALTTVRPELEQIGFEAGEFDTLGDRAETNYEVKYLREGRDIFRLAFRRRAMP
jgi:tRNA (guanine-N7-)-methyltransferase